MHVSHRLVSSCLASSCLVFACLLVCLPVRPHASLSGRLLSQDTGTSCSAGFADLCGPSPSGPGPVQRRRAGHGHGRGHARRSRGARPGTLAHRGRLLGRPCVERALLAVGGRAARALLRGLPRPRADGGAPSAHNCSARGGTLALTTQLGGVGARLREVITTGGRCGAGGSPSSGPNSAARVGRHVPKWTPRARSRTENRRLCVSVCVYGGVRPRKKAWWHEVASSTRRRRLRGASWRLPGPSPRAQST